MPHFKVPLVKETTEYEWAEVVVEAADEAEAVRKAIEHAEAAENGETDEEVEWNDHGAGYGGWEIRQTPNEKVELLPDEDESEE
mgnify:CR=1 FL=1